MSIFFAGNMVRQRHGIFTPFSYDPDALAYFARAGISSAATTPTAYDNAASFNGTNQYLISSSFTSIGFNSFSVSAWINPSVLVNQYQMIFTGETAGDFNVNVTPTGQLSVGQVGLTTELLSSVTISVNQWSHVVATADGSYLKIYINGVNVGTATRSYAYPINSLQINGWVGARYLFNGSISAVGYWSAALNPSQINALYNGGIGFPYNKLPATLIYDLVSYWALNETTGTSSYVNSTTTGNDLTPYNTPTNSVSPIALSTLPTQNLINNFVIGIKQLGLWSNMVCWPLRSSQNASSTLTAYSLGGAGTYNGTLVNIPSANWTSTGLLNSATGYVTTGLYTGSTASHNLVVVNETANGGSTYYGDLSSSNSKGTRGKDDFLLVGNGISFTLISYSATSVNNFKALNYDVTASTGTIYLNGSSIASGALTGLPPAAVNPLGFLAAIDANAANVGQYTSGTMAFYLWLNTNISSSSVSQLYTIYKQTLGQGLALP